MFNSLKEFLKRKLIRDLHELGWTDDMLKFAYAFFTHFWWVLMTPYRWLDFRVNRRCALFVKRILEKFGYTVESPYFEEEDPTHVPWYKNWDPSDDLLGIPTIGEIFYVINITAFLSCCYFVWTTVVVMYFHIPLGFDAVFRAFLTGWTILLILEWFNGLIK